MSEKKDKNDHLLAIRVPKQWVLAWEKMRDQYKEKGENRSVAQIVRESLEEHQRIEAQQGGPRLKRLYEMQQNTAETLANLRQKIIDDRELTRVEWEFLCLQVGAAYEYTNRSVFNSALLMDVVNAFRDYVRFRNSLTNKPFPDERYFRSNLISSEDPDAEDSLEADLEHTLQVIGEKPITTVGAGFISRNLEVCLRDETLSLPDKELHETFKPYGKSMLKLAARRFYDGSERSTGKTQTYLEALEKDWGIEWEKDIWSKQYEVGDCVLGIRRSGDSISAQITIGDRKNHLMQGLTFSDISDLFLAVIHDYRIGRFQGVDMTHDGLGNCYIDLNDGGTRCSVEKSRYEQVKVLSNEVYKDEEYKEINDAYELVYGAI